MSETEYVISSPKAWGKGEFESEALQNLANHERNPEDTVEIQVFKVKGFESISGFGGLRAEEILSKEEKEISGVKLRELQDLQEKAEILSEEILME